MKKKTMLLLGATTLGLAYSAFEGRGIFNKWRFKAVHNAVGAYVDSHYTNAFYSPITATQKGYISTITKSNGEKVLLYITKSQDNVYVFNEENIG